MLAGTPPDPTPLSLARHSRARHTYMASTSLDPIRPRSICVVCALWSASRSSLLLAGMSSFSCACSASAACVVPTESPRQVLRAVSRDRVRIHARHHRWNQLPHASAPPATKHVPSAPLPPKHPARHSFAHASRDPRSTIRSACSAPPLEIPSEFARETVIRCVIPTRSQPQHRLLLPPLRGPAPVLVPVGSSLPILID